VIDRAGVLRWGRGRLRDLPWRAIRDPWAILVAEVMLQQTQVPRVVPKWEAFRAAYPRPADCAAAPLGDILRRWQGLGYPRRARNLHRAANVLVTDHGGRVPDDLPSLLALPGVGPYTARAVLAFAFEHDVGVVETNIARVLARVGGARLTPRGAQELADRWVPDGEGWAWNQVLMDLGATVCRPEPRCSHCPAAQCCAWLRGGRAAPDPAAGSAGVSTRQPAYAGSAREARGRILAALTAGAAVPASPDPVVAGLVSDGLVVERDGRLALPD
jgi:A/G-specific adenine glycosylase